MEVEYILLYTLPLYPTTTDCWMHCKPKDNSFEENTGNENETLGSIEYFDQDNPIPKSKPTMS